MVKVKKDPAAKKAAPAPSPRADINGWVLCPGDQVLVVSPGEEYHGLFGRVDTFPTKPELSCYVQLDGRPSVTGRVLLPTAQLRWMGPDETQVEQHRPTRPGQQVRVVLENEALSTPEMKALEGKLGSVTEFSYPANDVAMVTVKFDDPELAPWPTAIYSYDLLVVPLPVVQYIPEPVPVEQESDLPFLDDKAPAAEQPAPAATPAPKANNFETIQVGLASAAAGLRVLPLASIAVTRNTRQVFDEAALAELAESIKAHGVLQPIVVRPTAEAGQYELVAGGRRYKAAQLAGLTELPVTVRVLTDREFLEVQLLENLQRVDVRPADEAQAFAELLKAGFSAAEIGLKVGKGEKFVLQRAKLADLTPFWLDLLAAERLPLVAAHELARLPADSQRIVAKEVGATWEFKQAAVLHPHTIRSTINSKVLHKLDLVAWQLDDATLYPPAGPCTSCPKRSGACRGLFDDLHQEGNSDNCLDSACFAKKTELFVQRRRVELAGTDTPILSSMSYESKGATIGFRHYDSAKAGEKGAVKALVVDGADAGKTKWVKVKMTAAAVQDNKAERDASMRATRLKRVANELRAERLRDVFELELLETTFDAEGQSVVHALLDYYLMRQMTFGRTRTPNDMLSYLVGQYHWDEPTEADLDNRSVSEGDNPHDSYIKRQLAKMPDVLMKVVLHFDLRFRDGLTGTEPTALQFNLVRALPANRQAEFDVATEAEQAVEARYYSKKGKKQEGAA